MQPSASPVHLINRKQNKHKVSKTDNITSLIEGCKANDRKAQAQLYQLTASKMLGVCMRYTTSREEAEDILQTGYVRVFTRMNSYRNDGGSFEGWIRRIMVNTAIESFRRNQRMIQADDIQGLSDHHAPGIDVDELAYEDLMNIIQELPSGYRLVFNMFAIEGYSHKEIADSLGITESTSKTQLLRAREWLKKRITYLEGGDYEQKLG